MPSIEQWLKLYHSEDQHVRCRAAKGLLGRPDEVPLSVLLDVLDRLSHEGLGADAQWVLLQRRDPELFEEMIQRLACPDPFIRGTACKVLGRLGSSAAVPHLIRMLDDPLVRREAVFALIELGAPESLPALVEQYTAACERRDLIVIIALKRALETMGVKVPDFRP